MSKKNWRESMTFAVETRIRLAQPTYSIQQKFYQVTQEAINAHQKEIMKEQVAVEAERCRDAQKAGAEAEAGSLDKHAEHVGRISEESMCREHLGELDWLYLIPKDKDLDWEAECLEVQARTFCKTFTLKHSECWPPIVTNMRLLTVEWKV